VDDGSFAAARTARLAFAVTVAPVFAAPLSIAVILLGIEPCERTVPDQNDHW